MAKKRLIPHSKWEWYGRPGHFICASWCRFHLCTLIGKVIVSTVGALVHPRNSGGSEATERRWLKDNWPGENVGCDRKFETMVFLWSGERCTVDGCNCNMPYIVPGKIDFMPANTDGEATKNHMDMCNKWASVSLQIEHLDKE